MPLQWPGWILLLDSPILLTPGALIIIYIHLLRQEYTRKLGFKKQKGV
jgi:hypothetical protein